MPRYNLLALTNAVPGREAEFNDWYTNVHLADVLKLPGVQAAQRFCLSGIQHRAGAHPWEYMAVYEIETDDLLATLAKLPFTAFGPGTDKGLPQRAKPEVWSDATKFKTAADNMMVEVGKLDAAAKSGSLDAIKDAMGGLGKSCKACHDDFRAEKYSAN